MPPHPSNNGSLRPTPEHSKTRAPTEGELMVYQTGVNRFPNLASLGSFRPWALQGLFPGITIAPRDFNCFAWSVGHTDRWLEGSTIQDMNRLYLAYRFVQCNPPEAEVELYRILDAPPVLVRNGIQYPNKQAFVKHAHRRDYPQADAPPRLGCSSKMSDGALVAHNRKALEDNRPWGSRDPPIQYGSIFQHWRRGPEHPSHPGKAHNLVAATGNYPNSAIFASGYGLYPSGHPGNTIGLPRDNLGNNQPGPSQTSITARKSGGLFSGASLQRTPQVAGRSSGAGLISQPPSSSGRKYALIRQLRPYDPIPLPSPAAQQSATLIRQKYLRSNPRLVQEFDARFSAWQMSWSSSTRSSESNARMRCYVVEFDNLLKMGTRILPLVVHQLLDSHNFTAVFLYNVLERNPRYLIDPSDVLNFLVLQRQSNLIVEICKDRKW